MASKGSLQPRVLPIYNHHQPDYYDYYDHYQHTEETRDGQEETRSESNYSQDSEPYPHGNHGTLPTTTLPVKRTETRMETEKPRAPSSKSADYKPTALRWWYHLILIICLAGLIGLTEYAIQTLDVHENGTDDFVTGLRRARDVGIHHPKHSLRGGNKSTLDMLRRDEALNVTSTATTTAGGISPDVQSVAGSNQQPGYLHESFTFNERPQGPHYINMPAPAPAPAAAATTTTTTTTRLGNFTVMGAASAIDEPRPQENRFLTIGQAHGNYRPPRAGNQADGNSHPDMGKAAYVEHRALPSTTSIDARPPYTQARPKYTETPASSSGGGWATPPAPTTTSAPGAQRKATGGSLGYYARRGSAFVEPDALLTVADSQGAEVPADFLVPGQVTVELHQHRHRWLNTTSSAAASETSAAGNHDVVPKGMSPAGLLLDGPGPERYMALGMSTWWGDGLKRDADQTESATASVISLLPTGPGSNGGAPLSSPPPSHASFEQTTSGSRSSVDPTDSLLETTLTTDEGAYMTVGRTTTTVATAADSSRSSDTSPTTITTLEAQTILSVDSSHSVTLTDDLTTDQGAYITVGRITTVVATAADSSRSSSTSLTTTTTLKAQTTPSVDSSDSVTFKYVSTDEGAYITVGRITTVVATAADSSTSSSTSPTTTTTLKGQTPLQQPLETMATETTATETTRTVSDTPSSTTEISSRNTNTSPNESSPGRLGGPEMPPETNTMITYRTATGATTEIWETTFTNSEGHVTSSYYTEILGGTAQTSASASTSASSSTPSQLSRLPSVIPVIPGVSTKVLTTLYTNAQGHTETSSYTTTLSAVPTQSIIPSITSTSTISQSSQPPPPLSTSTLTSGNNNSSSTAGTTTASSSSASAASEVEAVVYGVTMQEYVVGAFLPTVLAVFVAFPIKLIGINARLMQPFHALATADKTQGIRPERSIFLRFYSWWGAVSFLRALRTGQPIVAISDLLVLGAGLLAPLAAETVSVYEAIDTCEEYCRGNLGSSVVSGRVLQAFMAVMIALLLALIFLLTIRRWKTGVAQNPWSIAGTASLCLDSDMRKALREMPTGKDSAMLGLLARNQYALGEARNPSDSPLKTTGYGVIVAEQKKPSDGTTTITTTTENENDNAVVSGEKSKQPFLLLTWWGRCVMLFIFLSMLVIIVYYEETSGNTGFENFMDSQSYGVKFFFTALGVVLGYCMETVFRCVAIMSPYLKLRDRALPAQQSILLSPPTNAFYGLWSAYRQRHLYLAFLSFVTLLAELCLPVTLSHVPFSAVETYMTQVVCTWLSAAILALMSSTLLLSFFVRWPHMPVDPRTVAGAMFYVCDSWMLDSLEGMSVLDKPGRDWSVRSMRHRYGYGFINGMSGKSRIGVDIVDDRDEEGQVGGGKKGLEPQQYVWVL